MIEKIEVALEVSLAVLIIIAKVVIIYIVSVN